MAIAVRMVEFHELVETTFRIRGIPFEVEDLIGSW